MVNYISECCANGNGNIRTFLGYSATCFFFGYVLARCVMGV